MLMAELRIYSTSVDVIQRIIDEETRGEKSPKRRQLLLRLSSLSTRTQAARNLASAMSILQDAGPGKKEQAKEAASEVGSGASPWGDDLNPFAGEQGSGKPN
jgi:type II secretory pathway component PulF